MSISVRVKTKRGIKASTQGVTSGVFVAKFLNELLDVEISGNNDKYVLMYDTQKSKWVDKNPDDVLIAASTTETVQPGLPGTFVDTLDVDLDNRIDLDAGTW